jgi:hypothetical protein
MTNDVCSHKEKNKWATFMYVGKEVFHIKTKSRHGAKNQEHHKSPE